MVDINTLLLFSTFAILLFFCLFRNRNYWKRRGVTGPTPLPIFGNSLDNLRFPINDVEIQRYKKYGRIYGYFDFWKPHLTVGDPELLRQIGIQDFHVFQNHAALLDGDPLFSKLLDLLKNDEWKRVRMIVSPTFTTMKMKRMMPLIEKCIMNTLPVMDELANNECEHDFRKILAAFTVDVMAECAFAVSTNGHKDPENDFLKNLGQFMDFTSARVILASILPSSIQKRIGFQIVSENVLSFLRDTVKQVIEKRRHSDRNYPDFLQSLIDSELNVDNNLENDVESESRILQNGNKSTPDLKKWKKYLDENEILAQCITFFVAGYDTTSILLNYCIYLLASNPEKQNILFQEVRNYFKNKRIADYDSLNELTYLDAVVNESLRLYPPVAQFDRVAMADYRLGDTGIIVPKGTVINLPFYAMHRDPEFYSDPDSFKPERFLPENRHEIKPYTFLPFGIGPRKCIGMRFALMNAKLFLINAVFRYEFMRTENTVKTPIFVCKKLFTKSEPIMLKIRKRGEENTEGM